MRLHTEYLEVYFPMTVNILTPGHIKCLEWLTQYGFVTVGLLTSNALKGYKKEFMPYEDRKYIMDTIALIIEDIRVVPQLSLNPSSNIRKYGCNALASGDGFLKSELEAIRKFKLERIDIRLKGEKHKRYSTTFLIKNHGS